MYFGPPPLPRFLAKKLSPTLIRTAVSFGVRTFSNAGIVNLSVILISRAFCAISRCSSGDEDANQRILPAAIAAVIRLDQAKRGPVLDHFSAPVSLIASPQARSKLRFERFGKRFLASAKTWLFGRGRSGEALISFDNQRLHSVCAATVVSGDADSAPGQRRRTSTLLKRRSFSGRSSIDPEGRKVSV